MFDARLRAVYGPLLERLARPLAAAGVPPAVVTVGGFAVGVGACVAAALTWWSLALGLWLVNRLLDGLDGPVARRSGTTKRDRGGFLDIVADFAIYGGFVVGVAAGVPEARLACAALLATYYVNGTAFLALASLRGARSYTASGDRSLPFLSGLTEGAETVVAHSLFCLLPFWAEQIAWVFAGMVAFTAAQRVWFGLRVLSVPDPESGAAR